MPATHLLAYRKIQLSASEYQRQHADANPRAAHEILRGGLYHRASTVTRRELGYVLAQLANVQGCRSNTATQHVVSGCTILLIAS